MNTAVKDPKKRDEAQQHFRSLYSQRSEFMKEDRTGFVWLYLQNDLVSVRRTSASSGIGDC